MIGKCVSHYRILERLEGGGMGVVFKAEDVKLGRPVALKFLPASLSDEEEAKERFIQEAKAASALDHPNICTIYEIGETDESQLFIAMAFYEGETLARKIARGPLEVAVALAYAEQLAAGLAKSHEREIIHRDVKPGNAFVTADGQVKILDFGLAKMLGEGRVTLSGLTQGTPAYMAPERIRDNMADPRTDLWSVGVVLYEALSGERPFRGDSVPDVIQAIYHDEPRDLRDLRPEVSPGLAAIARKLLAKDAAARYRSCDELLRDLRELDGGAGDGSRSGILFPQPASALRPMSSGAFLPRRWRRRAAALAAALALLAALWWLPRGREPAARGGTGEAASPTLAVLFFDNPSGDPDLDWLRTGITELLVTDLSQSSRIRVLSTSQLHRALAGAGEAGEGSAELLRRLADRAGVDQVLLGSVVRSGDTLRIEVKLQEAASGRILSSDHVEGRGEESLLSMVDDLSLGIRQKLELGGGERVSDLGVARISTSSIEAWRFYSDGLDLHLRFKEAAAAVLFEKAVELDPGFSMAWAKLAVTARNLGRPEAVDHAARALLHAERLPPAERAYVEGFYASHDLRTWPRSRDAFLRALEHDGGHHGARQSLEMLYLMAEDHDRAVEHAQEQVRLGSSNLAGYATLAEGYAGRGDLEAAEELLEDLVRRLPEAFVGHCALGRLYARQGRLDQALASFQRAEVLQPGTEVNLAGLCSIRILRGEWEAARELARHHGRLQEPAARAAAGQCRMLVDLYRGRSAEALATADVLMAELPGDPLRARVRVRAAGVHLARGDAVAARALGQRAGREGRGGLVELEALFLAGRAELALGHGEGALALAEELAALGARIPGPPGERRRRHLRGLIALAQGRAGDAVARLEEAAALLPPRGLRLADREPDHAALWASLAAAYRAAGEGERAAAALRRIVDATEERVACPVEYVRSLYLLGDLHRELGQPEAARGYFERFLEHWGDGDLERDWVARAAALVAGGAGS
jgi:tetratricopeptide (TPR) repeat protein/TolB-like protein